MQIKEGNSQNNGWIPDAGEKKGNVEKCMYNNYIYSTVIGTRHWKNGVFHQASQLAWKKTNQPYQGRRVGVLGRE